MIHFNYSTKDIADSLGEIKQYIDILEQAEQVWEEAMFVTSIFENCQLIRTFKDMLGRMLKAEKTAEEIDAYRFFAGQNVELVLGRSLLEKDRLGINKHLDVSDYKQIYYLSQVYCDMQVYSAIIGYMTPEEYKDWFENDSKKYRKTTCSSFADIIPPELYAFIYSKGYGSVIAATDAAIMFQYQLQASGSYWYDFNLGQSFNAVTIYNGGIYNGTCKGSSSGASTSLTIDIGVASSSSNMFSYDTIEAYAAFPLEN